MLTFEQVGEILDEEANRLPREIFRELNGGIVLLPRAKMHPEAVDGDLYILGEYVRDIGGMGRYIAIYYGSFAELYAGARPHIQRKRLLETLRHELVHHLESLAGERDLEIEDEIYMNRYRGRFRRKK